MRSFIYLIVIAAAAYVGYSYYTTGAFPVKIGGTASSAATEPDELSSAPSAPAAPAFKSKIPLPAGPAGEKHLAKPGTYYVLERASIEHATGVAAVVPGEEVQLMMRKGNGVMKVVSTSSKYEFEMKESQLTNDLDVARETERKYVLVHPPAR